MLQYEPTIAARTHRVGTHCILSLLVCVSGNSRIQHGFESQHTRLVRVLPHEGCQLVTECDGSREKTGQQEPKPRSSTHAPGIRTIFQGHLHMAYYVVYSVDTAKFTSFTTEQPRPALTNPDQRPAGATFQSVLRSATICCPPQHLPVSGPLFRSLLPTGRPNLLVPQCLSLTHFLAPLTVFPVATCLILPVLSPSHSLPVRLLANGALRPLLPDIGFAPETSFLDAGCLLA